MSSSTTQIHLTSYILYNNLPLLLASTTRGNSQFPESVWNVGLGMNSCATLNSEALVLVSCCDREIRSLWFLNTQGGEYVHTHKSHNWSTSHSALILVIMCVYSFWVRFFFLAWQSCWTGFNPIWTANETSSGDENNWREEMSVHRQSKESWYTPHITQRMRLFFLPVSFLSSPDYSLAKI